LLPQNWPRIFEKKIRVTDTEHFGYYQFIGELFYCMAAQEGPLGDQQYLALTHLVHQNWSDDLASINQTRLSKLQKDQPLSQIADFYKWIDYRTIDIAMGYENFKKFYLNHQWAFTDQTKKIILHIGTEIIKKFSKNNPDPGLMKTRLEILFKATYTHSSPYQ